MDKTHKYYWRAVYSDGNVTEQFRTDNSERLFKDLQFDKLIAFELISKEFTKIKRFGITLDSGLFYIDDIPLNLAPEIAWDKKYKRKLIYFYRNWHTLSGTGQKLAEQAAPVIGFEVNIDGEVKNYMFMVSPNGDEIMRLYKK